MKAIVQDEESANALKLEEIEKPALSLSEVPEAIR